AAGPTDDHEVFAAKVAAEPLIVARLGVVRGHPIADIVGVTANRPYDPEARGRKQQYSCQHHAYRCSVRCHVRSLPESVASFDAPLAAGCANAGRLLLEFG